MRIKIGLILILTALSACQNKQEIIDCNSLGLDINALYSEADTVVIGKFAESLGGVTYYGDCDWNNKGCLPTQNTIHKYQFRVDEILKGNASLKKIIKLGLTESVPEERDAFSQLLDDKQHLVFLKNLEPNKFHIINNSRGLLKSASGPFPTKIATCLN